MSKVFQLPKRYKRDSWKVKEINDDYSIGVMVGKSWQVAANIKWDVANARVKLDKKLATSRQATKNIL